MKNNDRTAWKPQVVYDHGIEELDLSNSVSKTVTVPVVEALSTEVVPAEPVVDDARKDKMETAGPCCPAGPAAKKEVSIDKAEAVLPTSSAIPNVSIAAAPAPLPAAASMTVPVSALARSIPDGYALFPDGIYQLPDDETAEPVFVCSPLRVTAIFATAEGKGWGRVISVKSVDDRWHEIPVKDSDLYSRPNPTLASLVDHGLQLSDKKAADRLLKLLKSWQPGEQLQTVERMGWVDESCRSFVCGSKVIGGAKVLALPRTSASSNGLTSGGTGGDWRANVGTLCKGNPLMVLAVSLAFTGPLLMPLGFNGGGLHFRGASSSGKTTLLGLAASVWGGRQMTTQWRATTNGLEALALNLNDMVLALDEIAEISAKDLYDAIYMLANGTGKARMTKEIMLGDQARWRLALISSGEISVEEKLKEGSRNMMTGQDVRLIDIDADSRAYGVFDDLHGAADPAVFAELVQRVSQTHYGSVGHEFVRRLILQDKEKLAGVMRKLVDSQSTAWLASIVGNADGPSMRVAKRFALIGAAGTLATKFGLTGWNEGEALGAAERAFNDWHDHRYGAKQDAVKEFVKPLQEYLSANHNELIKVEDAIAAGDEPIGWRDATRTYLPPLTWAKIYPGIEGSKAAQALLDMQMLQPGDSARKTCKAPRQIPGRPRLYTVNTSTVMAYKAG